MRDKRTRRATARLRQQRMYPGLNMHPRPQLEKLLRAGWPAVQRWVDEKASETNTLEFKKSTTAISKGISKEDRDAIAESVSGFANTEGGLLIFGVEARRSDNRREPDVVQRIVPVEDLSRFVDVVGSTAREAADPKVSGVSVESIQDPESPGKGIVIVHVPRSFGGPHRAAAGSDGIRNHYFMRTAGSTTVIPHRMLAALFNARPEPRLVLEATWDGARRVTVSLRNDGPGTARNIRINATVVDCHGAPVGHVADPNGTRWASHAQGVLTMRRGDRLFAEETCSVGTIELSRTALQQVDGIKLDARVDSETTRPLIVKRELLRRDELLSFGLPNDE